MAAKEGHVKAQGKLGFLYAKGKGIEQDYKQALYWMQKSAEQGDATAQLNLGQMYNGGKGTIQDYKQAVYWNKKAAEQGDADAQRLLGLKYALGDEGVTKDLKQVHMWFNIATYFGDTEESEKAREISSKGISSEQILEAQQMAKQWIENFE